jgi:hypothetical protein
MTNEQYLIYSYSAGALLSEAAGCLLFLSLRGSFERVNAGARSELRAVFKRLFLAGFILPALAGFCSVSYRSCSTETYEKIVAHRSYLVAKNHEQ